MSFDDKTLWYVDAKVEAQVAALCPTLGVQMLGLDLLGVIGSFTDLAVALGADPAVSASAKGELRHRVDDARRGDQGSGRGRPSHR